MTKKLLSGKALFNKIKNHLLTQNRKSADAFGGCMYRDWDGNKCAVGCLIKDEFYSENLEGEYVDNAYVLDTLRKSGVSIAKANIEILDKCQSIHDDHSPKTWKKQLKLLENKLFG